MHNKKQYFLINFVLLIVMYVIYVFKNLNHRVTGNVWCVFGALDHGGSISGYVETILCSKMTVSNTKYHQ